MNTQPARSIAIPISFTAALLWMFAMQLARLQQGSAIGWLLCDYGQRLGALAILAVTPAMRAAAFRPRPLKTSWWETALWIVGIPLLYCTACQWVIGTANDLIPDTRVDLYPVLEGWLNVFDLSFGLLLVACHEEIVFRRCAREVFGPEFANSFVMVVMTSLLFAAYHWTTGIGNVTGTFFFGMVAMMCLRRTNALWPLIAAHFITDFVRFSGLF